MSLTLPLPAVEELTAHHGPLRTVLADVGPVDVRAEHVAAYVLGILSGKTLRESVIHGEVGPSLLIRLVEYIDPVLRDKRYGVEKWSAASFRTVDHAVRLVAEVEYEHQLRTQISDPALAMDRERFTGAPATFYNATDVS
ncbi:hypothetical protein ACQEVS_10270 [Streptomyces sp. CA-181903]|uniref:hypothetical protein n=1 Tax=Streptomyces sp. CA-181903 TaxID=3240055 RepID=UPI003D94BA37